MSSLTNQCFACGKRLVPVFKDDTPQYNEAVTFSASGTYGSGVFDPVNARVALVINICDPCLVGNKGRVLARTEEPVYPAVSYAAWDPEAER